MIRETLHQKEHPTLSQVTSYFPVFTQLVQTSACWTQLFFFLFICNQQHQNSTCSHNIVFPANITSDRKPISCILLKETHDTILKCKWEQPFKFKHAYHMEYRYSISWIWHVTPNCLKRLELIILLSCYLFLLRYFTVIYLVIVFLLACLHT